MTLSPRRDFFRKLALFGGLAALGSSTRVKAQTASNITTQDITCDNGMPAFLAYPAGEGFPIVAGDSARAPQGTGVVTVVTGPVEPPPG